MTDFISEFYSAMRAAGFEPKGGKVIADDKRHLAYCDGKRKETNGSYSLKIEGNKAKGYWRDFRIGQNFPWNSGNDTEISYEDQQLRAREREAIDKAEKAFQKRRNKRFMKLAKHSIAALPMASDDHPYLIKKGVKAHGLRRCLKRNELVMPLYGSDLKIWSAQRITDTGGKYVIRRDIGARLIGSYFPLADKDDNKDIILICEGYATGATLREATGYPVICAINSNNLKAVAMLVAEKYPTSRIIICADNDAFTIIQGVKTNVGVLKAKEASEAVGRSSVIIPDFSSIDGDMYERERPTDFNDLQALKDRETVKQQIEDGIKIPARDEAAASDQGKPSGKLDQHTGGGDVSVPYDWQRDMIYDGHGRAVKTSLKNKILLLGNHDAYKGVFRFNDFAHKIMVVKCPPWETDESFKIHQLSDIDITQTTAFLENQGLSPERGGTHSAIDAVAHNNHFHPAQEYFKSLEWDGVPRLDTWLKVYLGAEEDEADYLAFIGRKWLTAAVKRVFEPGCKFDHVLVLEGEQGRGKSMALKVLSTFGDEVEESYFTDAITIADIQNKDTIQKIQGSIIVELAELAGFNKRDDEEIKRWITLQHDDCRLPYERTTTRFSRQFVLSATTNSYDYLKDPTGNRRYWPAKTNIIDMEAIRRDRKQLWAEAYKYFMDGLYIGPTPEEMELATVAQEKRRTVDVWEDDVLNTIRKLEELNSPLKLDEIMKEMGMALRERDYRSQTRLITILKSNGFENIVGKVNGRSVRGWKKTKGVTVAPVQPDMYGEEIKF